MVALAIAILRVYEILLIVRILTSWFMPNPRGEMMRMLYQVTEPYLDLFRRALPFLAAGGIDFSPIAGFIVLDVIIRILSQAL